MPVTIWYHINRTGYAAGKLGKLATIKQAFVRGRTDGALVMVSTEPRKDDSEESWKRQDAFAAAVFPLLQEYLP